MLQTKLYLDVQFSCFTWYSYNNIISFYPGPKIVYSYVFYTSIQLYTYCILEMAVAMLSFSLLYFT